MSITSIMLVFNLLQARQAYLMNYTYIIKFTTVLIAYQAVSVKDVITSHVPNFLPIKIHQIPQHGLEVVYLYIALAVSW